MTNHTRASWDWREEGFQSVPAKLVTPRQIKVYRVWGGTASETGNPTRPGVCFAFENPRTRREAERLFSIWEWGNNCTYVTAFEVQAGTTLFIGKAHPGDFYQSGIGALGSQVFIETFDVQRRVRRIGVAARLANDMGKYMVVPNRDPGRARSS
jgi:hypothetical protein